MADAVYSQAARLALRRPTNFHPAAANGITIEYDTTGDPDHPPLLLIMGLGAQLIAWDDEFVEALARRGFYVIRYDNRDVGRSTWFDEAGVPDLLAIVAGGSRRQPAYLLADMADDAAGLLDALGIPSAHVLGRLHGRHDRPEPRHPASGPGADAWSRSCRPPATRRLASRIRRRSRRCWPPRPPTGTAVDRPVRQDVGRDRLARIPVRTRIGSGPTPAAAYDRAFHPEGTARQMVAIVASPDRTPGLAKVEVPTLVIHGESDPLVDPSGGRATAAAIPGAELWTIPGMGHDLPPELFEQIADRVAALAG